MLITILFVVIKNKKWIIKYIYILLLDCLFIVIHIIIDIDYICICDLMNNNKLI